MLKMKSRNQKGFTLIEIIAVLVILGILAAVAIPKFMGLQKDARESAVKGIQGAAFGAASLVYGKAAISGTTGATGTVAYDGTNTLTTAWGYPTNATELMKAMTSVEGFTATSTGFTKDGAPTPANCGVTYTAPTSATTQPQVVATVTGC